MEFKICRVCLDRTATISVFDNQGDVQYCAKMMKCANIVISETDGLPDSICEGCAIELAASYEFAARCEASDRALRALDRLHAAGAAAHGTLPERKPHPGLIKQEIKPESDSPDGSELFETYLGDCFEIDYVNTHDVQHDKIDVKKKKSKIYFNRHEISKYDYKYSKKVLPNHIRKRKLRLKTGPIQCLLCDRTLSCHSAFELHMRSHTKERPYTCDICKKSFSTKHIMKTHILKHYGIKENRKPKKASDKRSNRPKKSPYQCTTCGQMTASRSAMEDHMRTHTGEKPFTCELCGNKYRLKGTLQRHMHSRHPESHPGAQFICEHCGKIFYARTNIITHMRVHTGVKPYQCPFCPERFRQISSMIRHKRLHTGEKPFSCNICGRSFRDHSTLQKHKSVHSAEKKYNCHMCTKSFKRKEGLRIHIIRHSKEKPWVCSFCGLRVTSKGNLKTHTDRMHSERSGKLFCLYCILISYSP